MGQLKPHESDRVGSGHLTRPDLRKHLDVLTRPDLTCEILETS